ncbi:MAG: sulfite dehydrogenase [Pseudomonadota bacterium]
MAADRFPPPPTNLDYDQQSSEIDLPKNGLLSRRVFLNRAASFSALSTVSGSALAAAPGTQARDSWQNTPGREFANYGQPSPHEKEVIRWISSNDAIPSNGISWSPLHELEGIITPNGLHYERHHNGVPAIDPNAHRLLIHGLVDKPIEFSVDSLKRYPRKSLFAVIECGGNSNASWRKKPPQNPAGFIHGLVSCSEWTGVPLRLLLNEAGLHSDAKWAVMEGADAFAMTASLPLEKLLDDCLIALYQNGERLRPEQGYPMRLLVPGWEGVTHVKWLKTIKVTKQPMMARNETAKYTELLPSGTARQFTFEMGVKSVITAPTYGHQVPADGFYEISGLAWSGAGKIVRVEVSADGGQSWEEADLGQPILSRCFTRFRIPWQWQGQAAVLQSRATDERGNVQPTRKALIAERGRHGYYHYNAIVSWAVADDGYVSHTYVDAEETQSDDPFDGLFDF